MRLHLSAAAILLSAFAGTASAGFETCEPNGNNGYFHWVCACDGQLIHNCVNPSESPDCLLTDCKYVPDMANNQNTTQPSGDYPCCISPVTGCTDAGPMGVDTCNPQCPLNSKCSMPFEKCREGTCKPNPDPITINHSTGEHSPSATSCVPNSTCPTGEDCPDSPSSCDDTDAPQCGGSGPAPGGPKPKPGWVGDPIQMTSGNSVEEAIDVRIQGTVRALELRRYFTSNEKKWASFVSLGKLDAGYLPKPFGGSHSYGASLEWWHSLYTFVHAHGTTAGSSFWTLRQGDGTRVDFIACNRGANGCWAPLAPSFRDRALRLFAPSTGGFIAYVPGEGRYVYQDKWTASSYLASWYFLTRLEDEQYPASGGSARNIVQLTYAAPFVACPGQSSTGNPGVPYLAAATTLEGAQLTFNYKQLPSLTPQVPVECVLASVTLGTTPLPDGGAPYVAVYNYSGAPPTYTGTELAGKLSSVTHPDTAEKHSYTYSSTSFTSGIDGVASTTHSGPGGGVMTAEQTYNGLVRSQNSATPIPCDAGSNCLPDGGRQGTAYRWAETGSGAGNGGSSGVQYFQLASFVRTAATLGPRMYERQDCPPNTTCPDSANAGTERWESATLANGDVVITGVKDKRDGWTAHAYAPPDAGSSIRHSELRTTLRGALAADGGSALERTDFAYSYNGSPPGGTAAFEQRRTQETRASVLQSGQNTVRRYQYDTATNRLKSVIESGYTRTFNGTSWSTVQRFIGTFYFTNHVCLAGTADSYGRVAEVHGPCLVASATATDCNVSAPNYPITQYFYWPAGSGANTMRLQRVAKLTQATSVTACSGAASIDTTFDNYDSRGNPGTATDANGVVTKYTYVGDLVKSATVAFGTAEAATTTYEYDNKELMAIQFPEGNAEVFCRRFAAVGGGDCRPGFTGGAWRPNVLWKAKVAALDGSGWAEGIGYDYTFDGKVRYAKPSTPTENFLAWTQYDRDAHGREVLSVAGQIGAPAPGQYSTKRLYDGADNLVAIGFPFSGAPNLCKQGSGALSPLCAALSYDRANRLSGLDVFPDATATVPGAGLRSCFAYDAHGNTAQVKSGCATSGAGGDCSACTQPVATYAYDDFGNVVSATLPDFGTGTAVPIRFEYDRFGNVIKRQSPAMASTEYLLYKFDALDRPTQTQRITSGGTETLFEYFYDALQGAWDANCGSAPTNLLGRLAGRNDSFGTTWSSYDKRGNVIAELRKRASVACNSGPNARPATLYSYTLNNNLKTITYPYGRTITFDYGTGALKDRVSGIRATVATTQTDGGVGWVDSPIIDSVQWMPYGPMRSYRALTTAGPATIEYLRGENGEVAPSTGCPRPASFPTDATGRIRGLWVSSTGNPPSGDIYKTVYTWKADQLARADTCLLNTPERIETFTYDLALRVKGAGRGGDTMATRGGSFDSEAFAYDARGNVLTQAREDGGYTTTYLTGQRVDMLQTWKSSKPGSLYSRNYKYDADGRATSIAGPIDSTADAGWIIPLASGPDSSGAVTTVFKSATVNGAQYNYYYDSMQRRRLKAYPTGTKDEFFYDLGHQMLVEQGNATVTSPAYYVHDDYVWLDGKPIAVVRGRLTTAYLPEADSSTACARNGEAAACGRYFPVSDYLGKVVLVLDAARKVAATGEYDIYGYPNRVAAAVETAHPYVRTSSTVAQFQQPVVAGTTTQMKVRFNMVDVSQGEGDVGCGTTTNDTLQLLDGANSSVLASGLGGPHAGQVQSGWVQPSTGLLAVKLNVAGSALLMPACGPKTIPSRPGAVVDSYEFRRVQSGAGPFMVPLRFPGQYHDVETDLFENWNRYYEPSLGRYLQPEPMMQSPDYVQGMALAGHSVPVYVYALSNSLSFTDSTGLDPNGSVPDCVGVICNDPSAAGCYCPEKLPDGRKQPLSPDQCQAEANNPQYEHEYDPAAAAAGGGGGKGERGKTAKPSGTDNPFKKMRQDPKDPNKVIYKDPHTGKDISKPKPAGFDDWMKGKK